MTKSEKVPSLVIFFSKDHFNVKGRVKKIRVGRPTGTTHIFHLSLSNNIGKICPPLKMIEVSNLLFNIN